MALIKGLKCSRSHFWRIIRNPVYCGFVRLSTQTEGTLLIRGIHEPIVSEDLFYKVQDIVGSPKKIIGKTDELKETFLLKGYLICPDCSRKLRASYSIGRTKRYPYYHCSGSCKARLSANQVNESYYNTLQQFELSEGASELFNLILEDMNIFADKTRYLSERKTLVSQLEQQEALIAKSRKLFVEDKLTLDDFRECKKEYRGICGTTR